MLLYQGQAAAANAFYTLHDARKFAREWVGDHPEISELLGYAVSFDGVGNRITDLFPED